MTKEVTDIDELEALLAGLNDDELDSLELDAEPEVKAPPKIDSDAEDAALLDDLASLDDLDEDPTVAEAPPAKRQTRKKRLKPLDDTPAEAPIKQAVATEEVEAAHLESLATGVVDLITSLSDEFALPEEDLYSTFEGVLDSISVTSTLPQIEADMRELLSPTAGAGETISLAEMQEKFPDEEADGFIEVALTKTEDGLVLGLAEEAPESSSSDAELEELLALTGSVPVPSANPVPTSVTSKPTIRPTPTKKAGALNTFIDADQLQEDLSFTESNLSLAMTRQAALFAHYARLSADATYQSDRAKQQVELLEATLNQKYRDSMVMAGTKFTEKSIDSMVIQDSGYQAAQERAHEAKAIASMVATAADSFRHRKDMLIQVGADLRLEKQGELRMNEHPGQRAMEKMGEPK